jgi:ATP-binding cassette subfamily A (ABC1) protein 3
MEEASALANKVAIVAKRMLAVGTVSDLEARYATYEVHFSGRSHQDTLRAREVMARVPGAQAGDDLSTTRFQVPVVSSRSSPSSGPSVTLEELFGILAEAEIEFSVERPTLEAVFLKIVREHNVGEDDEQPAKQTLWAKVKNLV